MIDPDGIGPDRSTREPYRRVALTQVPRILGFQDRDAESRTHGCLDRNYWHYRLIDFSNARFQEGVHLIALLYGSEMPGNPWWKRDEVHRWGVAGIRFWEAQQGRGGFFSEAFPYERSLVGTAFSTVAACEASRLLNVDIEPRVLRRVGAWLDRNENMHVANQMAGAAAALACVYRLTNDERHRTAAGKKVERLLTLRQPEGYFSEYGGYDVGYLSINLSYIATYLTVIPDERLAEAALEAARFLESKLGADCSFDYANTSRKTQYLYPFGLVMLGRSDFVAKHTTGLDSGTVLNPAWMDDRFSLPLTVDYLRSYLKI